MKASRAQRPPLVRFCSSADVSLELAPWSRSRPQLSISCSMAFTRQWPHIARVPTALSVCMVHVIGYDHLKCHTDSVRLTTVPNSRKLTITHFAIFLHLPLLPCSWRVMSPGLYLTQVWACVFWQAIQCPTGRQRQGGT